MGNKLSLEKTVPLLGYMIQKLLQSETDGLLKHSLVGFDAGQKAKHLFSREAQRLFFLKTAFTSVLQCLRLSKEWRYILTDDKQSTGGDALNVATPKKVQSILCLPFRLAWPST